MELTDQDFFLITKYIRDLCGISIQANKRYLILHRLESLAESRGCRNFSQFYQLLKHNCPQGLQEQVINAITTHETSFFRDTHPFTAWMEFIIPQLCILIKEKKYVQGLYDQKIRIWSAGASTGQEPYSIAILLHEYIARNQLVGITAADFEILATDISSRILAKARVGSYGEMEIDRGLLSVYRDKYFIKDGNQWRVSDFIKQMITFRQVNLAAPFSILGIFDVIFCRNVLIYFDNDTKTNILGQFHHMLPDKGFLVLGATENTYGITSLFESVRYKETLFYKKV